MKLEAIIFLDHVTGAKELMPCVIFGIVLDETKEKITVNTWHCFPDPDNESNQEIFTIAKALLLGREKFQLPEEKIKRILKHRYIKAD